MKLYIVQGYTYDEQYIVCIKEDKEACIQIAKKLVERQKEEYKNNPTMRTHWFYVVEAKTDTLYFPGIGTYKDKTLKIWDEHDDID